MPARPAGGSAGWGYQHCPDLQVGLQAGGVSAVGGSEGWGCQRCPDLQVGVQAGGVSGVQGQGVQLFLLESIVD